MPATIIDGTALALAYKTRIAARAAALRDAGNAPRLDAILTDLGDGGARVYAHNQGRTCRELGIEYHLHELPATATPQDIAGRVLVLNNEDDVAAIMVHLPLPQGVDPYSVQKLIAPAKDVEGVNPANIGNIVYGRSSLAPCTALATIAMIRSVLAPPSFDEGGGHAAPSAAAPATNAANARAWQTWSPMLQGRTAVVIGASDVVGKPIAVLLMREDATVISCNKHTPDLADLARRADVLIAAAGVPGLVTADMVKPGAIVIDVGVSRIKGDDGKSRTVGDVAFDEVREVAGHLSPVPGGVGPMTVAMLLSNVMAAAERRA